MAERCSVCVHPEAQEIDRDLVSAVSYRNIVKRYGSLSISALSRHRTAHVSPALVQIAVEKRALDLEADIQELADRMRRLVDAAERDGRISQMIAGAKEFRALLELWGRYTGVLEGQPKTTLHLHTSPEWLELSQVILSALDAYPEAREAVLSAIRSRVGFEPGRSPVAALPAVVE